VFSRYLSRSEAVELWLPIRLEIIEDPLLKRLLEQRMSRLRRGYLDG
jgi:hypothetical protein